MIKRTILVLFSVLAFSVSLFAVNDPDQNQNENRWQQRMKSEKIAFLTNAMELTPKEAQSFWPLYNKAEKESQEAMDAFGKAYEELTRAVKAGRPEKEISELVNKYVAAEKTSRSIDAKYVPQYLKVISAEKVAKLFVGEEDFRRMQMRRFATGRGQQGSQNQAPASRNGR